MYDSIVGCRSVLQILNSMDAIDHLSAILALRKLCNHPGLLAQAKDGERCSDLTNEIARLLPSHIEPNKFEESVSNNYSLLDILKVVLFS